MWCSTKTTFNVYVSQRSQIKFEDEDYAVNISFRWVTTSLFSLRTTACDDLFVPSDFIKFYSLSIEGIESSTELKWAMFGHKSHYISYMFHRINTLGQTRII